MDLLIFYSIFAVMVLLFILVFFYLIAMKWINFGWALWFAERRWGSNVGFLMVRSSGNNIPIPKIINLAEYKTEDKFNTYIYRRDQLQGLRFFDKPFVMFDSSDNKTSLGLYAQESGTIDKDGKLIDAEPQYEKDSKGNYLINKSGQKIPILTARKPAVALPVNLFKSVLIQETFKALKKYLADVMGKNKYMLIGIVVIAIGVSASVYFLYDQQEAFPAILAACQNAAAVCGK